MKSITELESDLKPGKLSSLQKIETHFLLAASYLGINKEKCQEHGKEYLNSLSEDHQSSEKEKLINRVLSIAETGENSPEMVKLYSDLGDLYRRNQLDTAFTLYNRALSLAAESGSADLIASSYCNIAYVYNKQGEYEKSLPILEKALKLAKEVDNIEIISKCYTFFGEIHYYQGAFDETLDYYLKSLKLDEEMGDAREISKSYNNIGTVYYRINEFEKAGDFFLKALELKLTLPDQAGLAFSYNNLGAVNFILKNFTQSLEYYQKSLAIRENLNDIKGSVACCSNIGGVYFELKNTVEALKWFNRAYELSLQMGDKHNAALVIGNIANACKELGDLRKAVESAEIELKLAEELKELPLQHSACKTLFEAYEELGDFEKAFLYHQEYKYFSDRIYNNDSEKKIAEITARYDMEKKERIAEIHRLKNVELVEANRIIQRKNKELEAYKDDLLLINKILTHDIANDLSVIQSAIELYLDTPEEIFLNEIEKRANQSISTIRSQRTLLSTLDSVHKLKTYSLDDIFNNLASDHPQIQIKVNGTGVILADEAIYSVFENLVNNSLIHGKASTIKIDILPKKDYYEIRFADNGTGIPVIIKSRVFQEGFSYGKTGNTGIGLHIVKKTIERYGGTISVEDNVHQGTVLIISLRKAV
ncbi:MAG: tetratricopeptide repeat-containing sensor histidine kinase [Candidatus Cloacimonetes bacterium]|nr:tetratricopeptide repeat-containing sensor histidine kinase [Candidatus Cloacimonadota bacterium]